MRFLYLKNLSKACYSKTSFAISMAFYLNLVLKQAQPLLLPTFLDKP
jgi:hypothetical protein